MTAEEMTAEAGQGRFRSSSIPLLVSALSIGGTSTVAALAYELGATGMLTWSFVMLAVYVVQLGLQLSLGVGIDKELHIALMVAYAVGVVFAGDTQDVAVYALLQTWLASVLLYHSRRAVLLSTGVHLAAAGAAAVWVPTGATPSAPVMAVTLAITYAMLLYSSEFNLRVNRRHFGRMLHLQDESLAARAAVAERKGLLEQQTARLLATQRELQTRAEAYRVRVRVLRATNAERARLAEAASTDLREPLGHIARRVGVIGQTLERRGLTEGLGDYLHFVTDGAARMTAMVEDLLRYCDHEAAPEATDVDTAEVVAALRTSLSALLAREGAELRAVGELPVLRGAYTQVAQLLQNLVANGIKFRRPGVTPVVEIGCTAGEDALCFYVRDNGIGMPADRLGDVFGLFTRLHDRGAYEGTGIGLSLCRRIVLAAGGEIWAESVEGAGTTFFFTWPRAQLSHREHPDGSSVRAAP